MSAQPQPKPDGSRRQVSIKTLLITCILIGCSVAYFRNDLRAMLGLPVASTQTIDSVEKLEKLLQSERAIVFFDADWSATSKWRKVQMFDKLFMETQTRHPSSKITFALIDVTNETEILAKTRTWLSNQGHSEVLSRGNGEMLWIKSGKLLEFDTHIDGANHGLEKRIQLIQERYLD